MTTTLDGIRRAAELQADNDAACARRLREYQSDLADLVAAGEITDLEANQRASDFADRLNRDGAWN